MRKKNRVIKICEGCKKEFSVKRSVQSQKYCSMACRTIHTKEVLVCPQCKKEFVRQRSAHAKYCSASCSTTARNLTDKNPAYHRDISGKNNPMYGRSDNTGKRNPMFGKRRELNPAWKGGRKTRPDGYVRVIVPDDHPNPCEQKGKTKYILEHRLVMEKYIKRYLDPKEVVHHIDGNPRNNSIENLTLFSNQSEHVSVCHGFKKQDHPTQP